MPEVGPAGQVARGRVDFGKLGWKLKRFQSVVFILDELVSEGGVVGRSFFRIHHIIHIII